jgi:hypothetical protein
MGVVLKTSLILLWRYRSSAILGNVLVYYDPGARYFAEKVTRFFFDYGGITLAPGANGFFDVMLVIGFGIECLLAGFLLRWLLRRFQRQRPEGGVRRTPTKPNFKPSH